MTKKYDAEFAVATITRIRDGIAAIYLNSAPSNCQSQLINAVNTTFSTCATNKPL